VPWGWKCCCDTTANTIVVVSHDRYDTGGGVYASVTAYDGTSDSSGTLLWQYDLGLATTGQPWRPGHIRIDGDANVYIASWGIVAVDAHGSGLHDYAGKLTKLDANGSLQWEYTSVTTTNGDATAALAAATRRACLSIMDDGNILFSHPCETSSTYIMSIVDPTGSLVSGIPYPGGSLPTINVAICPVPALDVDSSGNIYFSPMVGTQTSNSVWKCDSSGSYIGAYANENQCFSIRVDRANGNVFAALGHSAGSGGLGQWPATTTDRTVIRQIDASALTSDWNITLSEMDGASGSTFSSTFPMGIGVSANGSEVIGTCTLFTNAGVQRARVYNVQGNSTELTNWTAIPATAGFNSASIDPVNGGRFYALGGASGAARIWKLNNIGTTLWNAFAPAGLGTNSCYCIEAGNF